MSDVKIRKSITDGWMLVIDDGRDVRGPFPSVLQACSMLLPGEQLVDLPTAPRPISVWRQSIENIEASAKAGRHDGLRSWRFCGPGWYQQWRVLVIQHDDDAISVLFYDQDPRDAFAQLATAPSRHVLRDVDDEEETP